jgi:hypothetical protein
MAGKSVDRPKGENPEVRTPSPMERFKQVLEMEAELDGRGGSNYMDLAIEEMLLADSFDQVMELASSDAGLSNGKSLVDVPLRVSEIQIVKSDAKYSDHSPIGFYVRIAEAVRLDTGKDIAAAVGAPKVVVPLWRARNDGRLPLDCVIKSREVSEGVMLYLAEIKNITIAG